MYIIRFYCQKSYLEQSIQSEELHNRSIDYISAEMLIDATKRDVLICPIAKQTLGPA